MANAGTSSVKIIDNDSDVVTVTSNRLDVNAYLNATPTIDIGDVSLLLGGTAASTNAGVNTDQTLRVTLASDDPSVVALQIMDDWDAVHDSAVPSDGVMVMGECKIVDGGMLPNSVAEGDAIRMALSLTGTQLVTLTDQLGVSLTPYEDDVHSSGQSGFMALAVRNDTLASLVSNDGDYAPLQVDADGGLYTTDEYLKPGSGLSQMAGIEYTTHYGILSMAVRNDTLANDLASAANTDGDIGNLQINSIGGLYVTGAEVENAAVQSEPLLIGGRYDSSARTLGSGDAGAVALNASGHVLMDVVDGGQLDTIIDTLETTLTAIETDQAAIEALLTTIDVDTGNVSGYLSNLSGTQYVDDANWTDGSSKHLLVGGLYQSSMQSVTDGDVAPFQVDANGVIKVSPSTGSEFQVDVVSGSVGHDITGMVSDMDADVGTTAEKIHTAADVAIKRIDIQASTTNTGYIYVGDSGVAGNGTGGGIKLAAGDFYSLDIDNTGDVYVAASVADEDVSYIYFT